MKVLFLTYDGLTDPLGQSQVLPYLKGLSEHKHIISVLSLEKQKAFQQNGTRVQEICNSAGIQWNYLPYPETRSRINQFSVSHKFKYKALSLAVENKIDLVHCRSYPSAMAGRFIQGKTGIPWIFDIRGFWIDERKEGNIWNFTNPVTLLLVTWLRHIEKQLYKKANAIVSLTHRAEKLITAKFLDNHTTKPLAVVPCCADYSFFKPQVFNTKQQLRVSLNLPGSAFIITYLGSLGTWYLLKEMIDFFAILLTKKPNGYFLFITGENPSKIRQISLDKCIPEERIIIRSVSREEIPLYLSAADCGISFIRPTYSKQASSPVKWAETLACGIPLIVNSNIGDIASLKDKLKGVLVLDDFSDKSYNHLLSQLPSLESINGEEISNSSRSIFDLAQGIQTYHQVYQVTGAKKILFIASHRPDRAPNQRFRFEQYFSYFEQEGFQCKLSYLIDKSDDNYIYKSGHLLKKAWFFFVKSILRRLKTLLELKNYDLIYIAREALMTRSLFFERQFAKSKAKLIFDFDDSIWLTNVSSANRWFHWMKNPGKTDKIIRMSSHVLAGNEYLADFARQWSDNVTIIPTTLDTDKYQPTNKIKKNPACISIGWTGSITTIPHFEFIIPVLLKIKEKYGHKVKFEVIGDPEFYYAGLDIIGKAWCFENEKEMLAQFDIGIMPLPDDEWTRGKCGFKGLLCMSLGIPVIMSPVGVNKEIISDGINGFLAHSEEEWFIKLCKLIDSEDLRTSMAKNGRQTIVDKYSMEVWKDTYIDIFKKLTGDEIKR